MILIMMIVELENMILITMMIVELENMILITMMIVELENMILIMMIIILEADCSRWEILSLITLGQF